MSTKKKQHHCKALTKTGKRCGAAATSGGLCFFHGNPNKASELGRIGGRSKQRAASESDEPLPTVDNAIAVPYLVARLIDEVHSGQLQPKIAAGLAPLLNLQLRAIETAGLEQRVARLEVLLEEVR